MATRLHENPISLMRFATLNEDSANTFTQRQQLTPVQAVGKGRLLALEICSIMMEIGAPSTEAGQNNQVAAHLSKESKSAIGRMGSDPDIILHNFFERTGLTVTSVGEIMLQLPTGTLFYDYTFGTGKGKIVVSRDIWIAVLGTGNASARFVNSVIFGYLVEIDADELIAIAVAEDI